MSARVEAVAVKLANHYLSTLLSKNPRHKPWDVNKPVVEARVFPQFVEAAKLVLDMEANPKDWVAAQFEWFMKLGKYKFPYPTQLATDNARLRYIEFMEKRADQVAVQAKDEHRTVQDPVKLERVKAQSLSKRFKLDMSEVLKMMPNEFSRQFHEQMGTWGYVVETYEEK